MSLSVETCLSPDLLGQFDLRGKTAVVIDVLRATSCMVAAFMNGADHLLTFENVEECREKKKEGYWIAGERNGVQVKGFDLGNSPLEYLREDFKEGKFAITTTNGTQAIELSEDAESILIGSFPNLSAVVKRCEKYDRSIVLVCAGWKGKVNVEDSIFAGALAEGLGDRFRKWDDATLFAVQAFKQNKSNLLDLIKSGSHAKRLKGLNQESDFKFCLEKDQFNGVPELWGDKITLQAAF